MGRNHRFLYPPFYLFSFGVSLRHFADRVGTRLTCSSVCPLYYYSMLCKTKSWNIFCFFISLSYLYYSIDFSFVNTFLKNFLKNFKFFLRICRNPFKIKGFWKRKNGSLWTAFPNFKVFLLVKHFDNGGFHNTHVLQIILVRPMYAVCVVHTRTLPIHVHAAMQCVEGINSRSEQREL